jgi:DNA-binding transcriptional LysR family regulator
MRPGIEDLATFVQVVESGTVTAAAARLGLAKSVVSKRVAQLEALLSARLLNRAGRRMTPTESGLALYERARALLRQMDAMVDDLAGRAGQLQGSIRIAAPMSFGTRHLGRIVAGFMAAYPRLEIVLDLDDRHVDLPGGAYDLALRIGRLGDSALRSRRLGASARALCCSPAYAARRPLPQSVEDLAKHECLGYANAPSGHLWRFVPEAAPEVEPRSIALRGRLLTNSGEALLDAAIAGLGLVVLPTFLVADAVRTGALLPVRIPGWVPVPDSFHLVWPETTAMPLKVRTLIEHLAERIRPPFTWDEPFG